MPGEMGPGNGHLIPCNSMNNNALCWSVQAGVWPGSSATVDGPSTRHWQTATTFRPAGEAWSPWLDLVPRPRLLPQRRRRQRRRRRTCSSRSGTGRMVALIPRDSARVTLSLRFLTQGYHMTLAGSQFSRTAPGGTILPLVVVSLGRAPAPAAACVGRGSAN
jgi:hypothetical protein